MIELLTFVFALEKNQISMRAAGLSAPEHVFRLAVEIIKWKYAIGLTYKGEENKIRSLWKNAIPFILWFGESQVSNRRRLPISGKQCSIFGLTRAKVIRVARSNCMRKWVCRVNALRTIICAEIEWTETEHGSRTCCVQVRMHEQAQLRLPCSMAPNEM